MEPALARVCGNCGRSPYAPHPLSPIPVRARSTEDFCAVVAADGRLLSTERGDAADVPEDLVHIAIGLLEDSVTETSFYWVPGDSTAFCRVTISVTQGTVGTGSATIAGTFDYGLPYGLTLRELDVLTLMTTGATNQELAGRLQLSVRTVTTHVDHVMRKLNVASRTSAAVLAVDEGLMRVPFPGGEEGFDLIRLGRARRQGMRQSAVRTARHSQRPLVIGAAFPMTGSGASDGEEMLSGTQLAIDELNARGGINGRRVEVDARNVDVLDAASIAHVFRSLAVSGVDALASGYFAHQDIAHEIAADAGIPYLHAATMRAMEQRVEAAQEKYGNVFQISPSDHHYAPRFVSSMSELRDNGRWSPSSNRLVVVQQAWSLTDLGVDDAREVAEAGGWHLDVLRLPADGSLISWADVADEIRRQEPAAVMLGHYFVEGTIAFVNEFLRDPSDTLLYCVYAPSVPEFRTRVPGGGNGVLWASVTGTYTDALSRAFVQRYRSRFGVTPGRSHAGIAYDRVQLLGKAWSQAQNPRDHRAVAKELRTTVHRGVNGGYFFGNRSQTASSYAGDAVDPSLSLAHLVFQIQDGRQRILSPSPYGEADFSPPSWLSRTHQVAEKR